MNGLTNKKMAEMQIRFQKLEAQKFVNSTVEYLQGIIEEVQTVSTLMTEANAADMIGRIAHSLSNITMHNLSVPQLYDAKAAITAQAGYISGLNSEEK